MNQPKTPCNEVVLPTDTEQGRMIVRELLHLCSPNIEYRSFERDSNYQWEKFPYHIAQIQIRWKCWEFRLVGCPDNKPATQIN